MNPELKYGMIAGSGMSAWMLGEYALGLHTTHLAVSAYTNWGTELVLFVTLWFFLRHKLYQPNRYWLPVWEGMLHGLLASLVAGLVFCTFLNFYFRFINPEWPDLYLAWRVPLMRAAGTSEESIRDFARSFLWSVTPAGLTVHAIGIYTIIGTLASSVLTLWLNWRRKEPVEVR